MSLVNIFWWIFLPAFIYFLSVRWEWIKYNKNQYFFLVGLYQYLFKPNNETISEMLVLWKDRNILFDIFNWDFEKYISHLNHYDEMLVMKKNLIKNPNYYIKQSDEA